MKRKIEGIIVCTLVIATALPAVGIINKNIASLLPSEIEWMKIYGGEEFNWLFDIEETDDGYIAAGVFEYQERNCAWLLKIDEMGNQQWSAINDLWYGLSPGQDDITIECVRQINGGYIVGGFGLYYNALHDYWASAGHLWKVNSTGGTEWLKVLVSDEEDWSFCPMGIELENDGFICGGWYVKGVPPDDYYVDIALFKTDFNGNILWNQTYDAGGFDWARSINKTTDGGYFLAGSTQEPNPYVQNDAYYILKTNSYGVEEWNRTYDGLRSDYSAVRGCQQTNDGGYITCGSSASWGTTINYDLWIVKTDAFGNMTWNKTYGETYDDHCYGMDATDNGYVFVVVKNAWKSTGTKEDLWIIETDYEGNPKWEFEFLEDGTQWLQAIHQTKDKGFIIAGRTGTMGSAISDGIIMKIAPFPDLDIEVSGGLGVNAKITNNGYGNATEVPYEINVKGGLFGMINKTKVGLIDIPAGESKTISTGMLIGLGKLSISVKVAVIEKSYPGKILLFFCSRIKDG